MEVFRCFEFLLFQQEVHAASPSIDAPTSSIITAPSSSIITEDVVDDLHIEILTRLPVQSLLRFKLVCKSWHALIAAPDFIHRHATVDESSNKLGTFIFQYRTSRNASRRYFLLSADQFEVFKDLGAPPLDSLPDRVNMVGSCHGIICLYDDRHGDIYLWNPAMKQFRLLPKSFIPLCRRGYFKYDFVAFGFDVKVKDYKVITRFTPKDHNGGNQTGQVQVYSLNTDSWRFINVDPGICGYDIHCTNGRYLNGKYYFTGYDSSSGSGRQMILSFDFSQETFRTIWSKDDSNDFETTRLIFIGEKVGYISCYYDQNEFINDIWELNEHCGNEAACTTKRYTIGPMHPSNNLVFISKNGKIAITDVRGTLIMHNLVTQEVKHLPFVSSGTMLIYKSDVYKESFISVGGNNGLSCDDNNNKYN